ncbi:MAG: FAD-dependent oxidoreductase [Chlorobium sp.]|nr:MAG: FAD-dependent oxidoreductase [Chlorobium sp.]
MMQNDVVVVGGGISGLSLAYYSVKAGMKTTLIEKDDSTGGSFSSPRHRVGGREFWLELGAHTCYSSYKNLLDIVEGCGLIDAITPRAKVPFSLYKDGEVKSLVSSLNIAELLLSAPKIFSLKKSGLSVKDYYSKIVGHKNYNEIISHFFNAVPSQVTDDFPADLMFKSREKRKDVLKNYTFAEGLQSIAKAISASRGLNVFTSREVVSIQEENGKYIVITSDGTTYASKVLALAVPSSVASRLLGTVKPAIAEHLGLLGAATVDSVGVVIRKENLDLKPVAALISPNDLFFSAVSLDTVPHDNFRGFAFHFRPGFDHNTKMTRICEVLRIAPSKIEKTFTRINTVPSLCLGHHEWLEKTDTLLKGQKNLLLTGNYFGGMAIEDCVSRSKSEFSRVSL